ncbi:hypothetical protein O181_024280 [Austropuccinia psidii MF-1]|uniref:Uncharacterized protein n=1 Tax=Austropuccinia psidii MF-1 TaxID=1389203 RepID=A0A9Q3CK95_9BASI|nr:hypothetical protein [Austropuccinia psidii MF-1]
MIHTALEFPIRIQTNNYQDIVQLHLNIVTMTLCHTIHYHTYDKESLASSQKNCHTRERHNSISSVFFQTQAVSQSTPLSTKGLNGCPNQQASSPKSGRNHSKRIQRTNKQITEDQANLHPKKCLSCSKGMGSTNRNPGFVQSDFENIFSTGAGTTDGSYSTIQEEIEDCCPCYKRMMGISGDKQNVVGHKVFDSSRKSKEGNGDSDESHWDPVGLDTSMEINSNTSDSESWSHRPLVEDLHNKVEDMPMKSPSKAIDESAPLQEDDGNREDISDRESAPRFEEIDNLKSGGISLTQDGLELPYYNIVLFQWSKQIEALETSLLERTG